MLKEIKKLSYIFAMIIIVSFAGCGSKEVSSKEERLEDCVSALSEQVSELKIQVASLVQEKETVQEIWGTWCFLEDGVLQNDTLEIYSDGTYYMSGEYGVGTWAIVNDSLLKLIDCYDDLQVFTIISIDDTNMTLEYEGEKLNFRKKV